MSCDCSDSLPKEAPIHLGQTRMAALESGRVSSYSENQARFAGRKVGVEGRAQSGYPTRALRGRSRTHSVVRHSVEAPVAIYL